MGLRFETFFSFLKSKGGGLNGAYCRPCETVGQRSPQGTVYEAGAVDRPEKGKTKVIGDRILEKERKREFELSRSDRFRFRTRYFTDSGVIGSKEFVSKTYLRFKHHFNSKNEKKTKPVKGLSGIYLLKRLSEEL